MSLHLRRSPARLIPPGAKPMLLLAVIALALSACSSGSSTPSASASLAGSSTTACMTKAENFLKPWDTLPTTLNAATYTPLPSRPKPGGTVIKLVGPVPSDQQSFEAQAQAAKAIGWTAKEITEDDSVQGIINAFNQAISDKPTVITLAGIPVAQIQNQLAAAKAAGIVVSLSSITTPATSYPGYAANSNGVGPTALIGQIEAYEFMQSSHCAGNAAIFTLPFPILAVGDNAFTATVKANCPKCVVSTNEIQTSDIGTPAATSAIVSKLQSSPATKYVLTVIGNLADGLSTALSQAGISGIQIFGADPDNASIKALQNGTNAFWVNQSPISNGWTELDAALRAIAAHKPVTVSGVYPLAVLTPKNVPAGSALPVYPLNYQQEFRKIWRVAS